MSIEMEQPNIRLLAFSLPHHYLIKDLPLTGSVSKDLRLTGSISKVML